MPKFVLDVEHVVLDGKTKAEVRTKLIEHLMKYSRKISVRDYICKECGCENGRHYGSCSQALVI